MQSLGRMRQGESSDVTNLNLIVRAIELLGRKAETKQSVVSHAGRRLVATSRSKRGLMIMLDGRGELER